MLDKAGLGLRFNEHMEGDGPTIFAHACKMGLEGIVSKRKDSMYRSGRSPDWLKMKNLAAPAVKREEEQSVRQELAARSVTFACNRGESSCQQKRLRPSSRALKHGLLR